MQNTFDREMAAAMDAGRDVVTVYEKLGIARACCRTHIHMCGIEARLMPPGPKQQVRFARTEIATRQAIAGPDTEIQLMDGTTESIMLEHADDAFEEEERPTKRLSVISAA